MVNLWAGEWRSRNNLDGERRHIINENCLPVLFRTRSECRTYLKDRYGYITERQDLRDEPHGWRMPQAVKITITMEEMKKKQPYEKFSGVTTNTAIYYHGVYKPDQPRLLTDIKKMLHPLCTSPVCPIEGNHSCMYCV
ncbi:hypothetical protein LCGC14_2790120, partial [marine sediment metagenome]